MSALDLLFNADQLIEALSASSGGVVATVVLYPLEIVKNLMNSTTAEEGSKSFMQVVREIQSRGGYGGFYRGCTASSIQSFVEKGGYFYFYTAFKVIYSRLTGAEVGPTANLVLGYLSEWSHLPFSMPIETVMVRLQKGAKGGPQGAIQSIMDESGISGFYSGINTQIVWALKPAIEYAVFEQIKRFLLKSRAGAAALAMTALEAFVWGGAARAVATIITFPGNRAKMVMQGLTNSKDTTMMKEMKKIVDEDGVLALYNGIGPEIGRGVFSSAIKMMVKERIFLVIRLIVYNAIGRHVK